MRRKAFTLVECVVALALFALVAIVMGQACFNCIWAVDTLKKDAFSDAMRDYLRLKVLNTASLTELKSGISVKDFDGKVLDIKGEAEATDILDLFKLNVWVEGGKFKEVFYLRRPNWYSQLDFSVDRDELKDDRAEILENARKGIVRE